MDYQVHLGEKGTEQFAVETRVDGLMVRKQLVHDPFIHNKTVIWISRWDHFKAIFKKRVITVEIALRGSEGAMRTIMMMNPVKLDFDTKEILEQRRLSREAWARGESFGSITVAENKD